MYPLKNGAHSILTGLHNAVQSLPNYTKAAEYPARLVNKDGIRSPVGVCEWEFRNKESDALPPEAKIAMSMRHRKSDFAELDTLIVDHSAVRPSFSSTIQDNLMHPILGRLESGLVGYAALNH